MLQRKAPVVRFGGAIADLPVWGAKKRPIKNREMGVALALSGQNFKVKRNNKKEVSGLGRRDVEEES